MAAAIPAARGSHDDGDRNTIPGGCSWTGEPLKEAAWAWTHSFSPKWLMHHAPLHVFEVLFSLANADEENDDWTLNPWNIS